MSHQLPGTAAWAPLLLIVAIGAGASPAAAEPRFAVREGMRCGHCHVNQTGGGMRTDYGAAFTESHISTFRLAGAFDPNLGQSVAMGANLRLVNRTIRATHTAIGSASLDRAAGNSFETTEGNLYLRADVIGDHLTVYLDETVAPEGASAREAFVMLRGWGADGYVKAGRILLPFGLRLPDDAAFIRQETGFTYANQDLGVEIGMAPEPFSFALAVSNGSLGGSDPNLHKQITAQAQVVGGWIRGGLSFAFNDSSTDDFEYQTYTSGGHVGLRLGRLVALGELDWIRGVGEAETVDQFAAYSELDYEAFKGLHARFVFEAYDPLESLANNERDRFAFGVSWFPIQHLEVRGEYRVNRDIPQRVEGNADEIIVELHGFL